MAYKIRFQKGPESVGFFLNTDLTDSTDLDGSENFFSCVSLRLCENLNVEFVEM